MKKAKGINGKLDTAWSLLIKLIAGHRCECCGKTSYLNSHHVHTRARMSTRWSVINGICLCVGCHIGNKFSAHKTPMSFGRWFEEYKGAEFVDLLIVKSNTTSKLHEFEKELMLEDLKAQINTYK
jgi:hypothetical protein